VPENEGMAAIQTQTELDADSFSLYIEVTGKPVNPRRELLKGRREQVPGIGTSTSTTSAVPTSTRVDERIYHYAPY
jgi:hypothetical protein